MLPKRPARGPSIQAAREAIEKGEPRLPRIKWTEDLPRFMVCGDHAGWRFKEDGKTPR